MAILSSITSLKGVRKKKKNQCHEKLEAFHIKKKKSDNQRLMLTLDLSNCNGGHHKAEKNRGYVGILCTLSSQFEQNKSSLNPGLTSY